SGSGQQAVHFAAQAIISGGTDVVVAGGVESMSRVPIGSNRLEEPFSETLASKYEMMHQGISAERNAAKRGFSREELDAFSLRSHEKAIRAQREGRFEREIMPLEVSVEDGTTKVVTDDEGPRADTSLEKLASLKPAFQEDGRITAGNSSQISDG